MPSVLFFCPHCEKHAEVKVTSVTRSRPCPHCGEPVLLQTGAKDSKRRALLVGTPEIVSAAVDKPLAPAYEPQVLEGEAFERMRMDPEVRAFRNKLLAGVAMVAGLIILAVVFDVWFRPAKVSTPDIVVAGLAKTEEGGDILLGNTEPPASPASLAIAAELTARRFMAAQSANDWLGVVDNPQRWESAIKRHVLMHPLKPLPVLAVKVEEPDASMDGLVKVWSTLLGGEKAELFIVWKEQKALVDWPSTIGWSAIDWEEFANKTPQDAVTLRVLAVLADRFEGAFSDSDSLICLKLTNPLRASSAPLFAYTAKESSVGRGIEALVQRKVGFPFKLMLLVRYPSHAASSDQIWIDRLVSESWYERVSVIGSQL